MGQQRSPCSPPTSTAELRVVQRVSVSVEHGTHHAQRLERLGEACIGSVVLLCAGPLRLLYLAAGRTLRARLRAAHSYRVVAAAEREKRGSDSERAASCGQKQAFGHLGARGAQNRPPPLTSALCLSE